MLIYTVHRFRWSIRLKGNRLNWGVGEGEPVSGPWPRPLPTMQGGPQRGVLCGRGWAHASPPPHPPPLLPSGRRPTMLRAGWGTHKIQGFPGEAFCQKMSAFLKNENCSRNWALIFRIPGQSAFSPSLLLNFHILSTNSGRKPNLRNFKFHPKEGTEQSILLDAACQCFRA